MHKQPVSKRTTLRGFSMVEVLVTLFILSVGLLGLATLQTYAFKANNAAVWRSQSASHAYEILERMRVNRDAAIAGNYDVALGGVGVLVAGANVAQIDIFQWRQKLDAVLPGAQGGINCPVAALGACTVTVRWQDVLAADSSTLDVVFAAQL